MGLKSGWRGDNGTCFEKMRGGGNGVVKRIEEGRGGHA